MTPLSRRNQLLIGILATLALTALSLAAVAFLGPQRAGGGFADRAGCAAPGMAGTVVNVAATDMGGPGRMGDMRLIADRATVPHGTPTGATPATGAGAGAVAGDDWACTIVDTRASDGAGATVLDVTLKANGCYQVQSPPGAVGTLYVNNDKGRPFLNPLFAFDGCLGTP